MTKRSIVGVWDEGKTKGPTKRKKGGAQRISGVKEHSFQLAYTNLHSIGVRLRTEIV